MKKLPSRITVEGLDRAPHRAFLHALGLKTADFQKPFVGVASTDSPHHALQRAARRVRARGLRRGARGGRRAVRLRLGLGRRLDVDESRRHALFAGVARDHRRRRRGGGARPRLRRARHLRRLRQDAARDDDGDGAAQPAGGVRLRRRRAAGHLEGPRRHRARHLRSGGRRAWRARSQRRSSSSSSEICIPTLGSCPGQFTANTMAMVSETLGLALPGSATLPAVASERAAVARSGRRSGDASSEKRRSAAARAGDEEEPRERLRRGRGDRRLDQRRAAHSGDRARGRHPLHARRLRARREAHAADRRHEARRAIPREGPARGRRRLRGPEGVAERTARSMAIASPCRVRPSKRRWQSMPAPTARWCEKSRS